MQTTATRTTTRIAQLAATLALAGGLLVGSTAATAAGFNPSQPETHDGGGGGGPVVAGQELALKLRLALPTPETKAPVGIWRGGRYVGFLPE